MDLMVRKAARKPFVSTKSYDTTTLPRMLNGFDMGFVGYRESDSNFAHIENASAQLVDYLRLGIPVIACGPLTFTAFVTKTGIGVSVSHPSEVAEAALAVMANYGDLSSNGRRLFEEQHDLRRLFESRLVPALDSLTQFRHTVVVSST